MIEFRNVKKIYSGGTNAVALDEVSFVIEKEEFVYESGIWINQIVKAVKK